MNRHSRYTAKKHSQARLRTPDGSGSLRKLLYPVLLLLFFAGQLGCGAYFNTFYNAQKYFKEAEKKRLKQQQTARRGGLNSSQRRSGRAPARARQTSIPEYKKAIEKGSKVLELYPNSRYVDDALMIIGKSLYYTNDFLKAKRKFEELLKYFPKSEYAPEARLWLAKTLIALKDYDSALGV
ncbi:MAG TPA: tetratricopeptide repeat protein, partial [Bacteroidetes bacterium]|nr:tetratricopeptide repeat protein [Bacteroidota bacterium]